MRRGTRLRTAVIVVGLMAGGALLDAPTLQAAGKKDGDGGAATCAYLLSVITYPYVSPSIKLFAVSLYNSMGCQPALPQHLWGGRSPAARPELNVQASISLGMAAWYGVEAHLEFFPYDEWRVGVSDRDAAVTPDHLRHQAGLSMRDLYGEES